MKRLEWHIARRYLASRRKGRFLSLSTAIAVSGIALGVAALITVIAVMTGLQQELRAKILGSSPHIYVSEYGGTFRVTDWRPVADRVREVPGVKAVQPITTTNVLVTLNNEYAQPGLLYGLDTEFEGPAIMEIDEQIRSGELSLAPTESGLPGILVGIRLAEKLGVVPGHEITTLSVENMRWTHTGLWPTVKKFEVTGLVSTGMYEYDALHIYTSLDVTREMLEMKDEVGMLAVRAEDPWLANEVAGAISKELQHAYHITDWMTLHESLFSALQLEKLAMAIILFLIVVVAAFNIVSNLVMLVADKTREIGILKSMGLTDGRVLRAFMIQGLSIGVIGALLGAPAGVFLVWLQSHYQFIKLAPDIYFVEALPVAITFSDVALIVAASILIAFVATIYPARQASRLTPVEAIRHE